MSKVDFQRKQKKEEEEKKVIEQKKVVGQQQKTQTTSHTPTGTTSIPKDTNKNDSRTQKGTASLSSTPQRTQQKTQQKTNSTDEDRRRYNMQRSQRITGYNSLPSVEEFKRSRMSPQERAAYDMQTLSNRPQPKNDKPIYRNGVRWNADYTTKKTAEPTRQTQTVSGRDFVGSKRSGLSDAERNDLEKRISNVGEYRNDNNTLTQQQKELEDRILNADRYTEDNKKAWNEELLSPEEIEEGVKRMTPETLKKWTDGGVKLDKGAEQIAKEYAKRQLNEYDYRAGHVPVLNKENREKYADLVNLMNKTSPLASFSQSALQPFLNVANVARDAGVKAAEKLGFNTDSVENYNKQIDESNRKALENARVQDPGLSVAGQFAGNAGLYAMTNPIFDSIGAAAGVTSKAGKFALNQAGQNLQDLALDTIPTFNQLSKDGSLSEEDKRELASDAFMNVLGNAVMGGASELLSKNKVEMPEQRIAEDVDNLTPKNVPVINNTNPYEGIDDVVVQGNVNKALGFNTPLANLKDAQIENLTKRGGDQVILADAYDNLLKTADKESIDDFTRSLNEYRQIVSDNEIPGLNRPLTRLEDAVNGNILPEVGAENYGSIANNVDAIEDGLNRISRLEGLSDLGAQRLDEAYKALDVYDETVRQGGDTMGAAKELSRVLGSLDNQAKKIPDYDGVFTNFRGDSVRGALYSNTGKIKQPIDEINLTPEVEAELHELYDFMPNDNRFAIPANGKYNSKPQDVVPTVENATQNKLPMNLQQFNEANNAIPEVEGPKKKVSQTYTNTGKRGGGWNEEEYTKYTDPKDYVYETKSEADSVARAETMRAEEGREAFKERVFKEERVTSEELDGLMMEWRELTEEARAIEAEGGDASQLWNESNRVFRKIREQSTNNAQALQALAKWSRNTPEGMLVEAENIVNGKVKVEKGELQKQLEKYLKKNHQDIEFSGEFEQQFLNLAEEFKKYDPDSREAKDLMAEMGRLVDTQIPKKLSQKVQSWLMDSMLGNFRTLIARNAGGNLGLAATEQVATRPLAAGIDSLVSLKTGKRTQAGFSKQAVGEYLDGMKKGIADEIHDLKTGFHTARTGENTLENAIKSNQHVFQTKILDKFDSLVKNGLSMGDRPFYEATYAQTLGDYYRLRSKMGPDIASLTDDQFKEYAETAANLNALAAVYQNDSKLAKGMLDLKNAIGQISEGTLGVDILSQFSMPFVKTPANVIDRAIDYSPVGAIRNTIRTIGEGGIGGANFDQNRFVNETARNIIGTGITAGGAGLAYANRMSGSYSDDADEKKAQQDAGMQEYALNVPGDVPMLGGKQVDIGWMPIVGSNLVAGTAAYDAYRNGEQGSNLDNLYAGVSAGGNELFGQAAMQGAQRLFGGSNSYNKNESLMDNAKNVVAGGFSQAIPSLARQIAQVADPYKRDVGNSNGGNYELNQILNALPYFRQNNLVPKVDSSGNPVLESQGRDIPSKILEDMILPGRVSEIQFNRLDEEAMALSQETGNKTSYMPKAVRKNVEDDSRKLTNDEWYDYQVEYGKSMTAAGEAMINNELYASIGPTEKESALQDIYTAVKSSINNKYKERELTGAAKVYANEGLDAAIDYVIYGNTLTANGLKNNEKNRGLLEENGLDYVNELNRQKQEKADINSDGNSSVTQDEILDYLNKGNYSNEEAQKIWNTYKSSNSKKELKQNANGEWELSGSSKKTSSNSNKTSGSQKSNLADYKKARDITSKSEIPSADDLPTADSSDGLNWSLNNGYDLKNTKTYARAKEAGISDSDFVNAWWAADTDGNGYMKKAEAQAYVNALQGLSKEERNKWFNVLYKGR